MVTRSQRLPIPVLAGVVLGAGAITAGALVLTGTGAAAAPAAQSTAWGITASGTDPVSAQPVATYPGTANASQASVASPAGTVTAEGLSVSAGPGSASVSVQSVRIAGKYALGPISASCRGGVAAGARTGIEHPARNITVTYGVVNGNRAAGAEFVIGGAGSTPAEQIYVADVECSAAATPPPTSSPTPTPPPGGGAPTTVSRPPSTTRPHRVPKVPVTPIPTAPPATPHRGAVAVTG